ncbi:MAG: 1-acyl-sn-glycerol-3-phosphate acyltransferase [Gammaproteobacteria bacterium]|nr:1-acyl-sn-glycerol-3-phosphate acyltransferase [Gammaproteobacteria bacterium]
MLAKEKNYESPKVKIGFLQKMFPTFTFYFFYFSRVVYDCVTSAKRGTYDNRRWAETSYDVMAGLEKVGVRLQIENLSVLDKLDGPVVFIGNHMSMLETMVLPCLIEPRADTTFVVKQALIDYPAFKHVMRSRDPIVVGRTNPRDDLKAVLEDGVKILGGGRSIIVFPQTTRTNTFDSEHFNSIGVKLAKKAGVKVVPIALKTDAWQNGSLLKDFGKIIPKKMVHIKFGDPLTIEGNGKNEHQATMDFIQENLSAWHA